MTGWKRKGRRSKLRAHLLHYSNDSIAGQIAKIAPYQKEFVKRRLAEGAVAGIFPAGGAAMVEIYARLFLPARVLDGWQGFYIAALSSFSALTRQAMIKEAKPVKPPPPP